MLKRLIVVGLMWLVAPAWAEPPLVADGVIVGDAKTAVATLFGSVVLEERRIAGEAAMGDDPEAGPSLSMLGCRFRVALDETNEHLRAAAPVFSKKLASGDPPPAGFGRLTSPTVVGLTDPLTVVICDESVDYFVFFFRKSPTFGRLAIDALVLEYDADGSAVFGAESFDPAVERPSVQTRNAVRAARNIYRMQFRTREDAKQAELEQSQLLSTLARLAITAGVGLPIP